MVGQRVGGPHRGPAGQSRARSSQLVDLAEGHHRTRRLVAAPQMLAPHHAHQGAGGRYVVQTMLPATVGGGENPAFTAPGGAWGGLDRQRHHGRFVLEGEDVDVGQVDQRARGRASSMGLVEALQDG